MPADRFFVEGSHAVGDEVTFEGADAHKIAHVLRKRSGDSIEVLDSAARAFAAQLTISDGRVRATLREERESTRPPAQLRITIAQALPKGQKMDFIVEKLTELGVARIIPFTSERSLRAVSEEKVGRWKRLARAAAQQSGRTSLLALDHPVAFEDILRTCAQYDCALMPWELASAQPLRERLPQLLAGVKTLIGIIGPEGGFSADEADQAQQAGAHLISLGSTILRTETAPLVLAAILQYACA